MKKLIYVDTKKDYGNMNTNAKFYPEEWTAQQRREDFMRRRIQLGHDLGFDGHKMFMADQVDSGKYLKGEGTKIGTSFQLTEDYVEAHPNGWSDIPEDILIITKDAPGIVAGHPVADCPVVMITDRKNGFTAVGHCSAELIDVKLPMMIADRLCEVCGSHDEDLLATVGVFAGSGWTYNNYPSWAKDRGVWDESIIALEKDGKTIFKIDLQKALKEQFEERNIRQYIFSNHDTITDSNYYSNFVASPYGLNDLSKAGRHFIGAFYREEENKIKQKKIR